MVITSPKLSATPPPSSSNNLGSGRTASQAKNLASGKGFSASNLQPKTASQAKNNIAPFKRPPSGNSGGSSRSSSSSLSSSAKSSSGLSGVSKAVGATRLGVNAKGDISLGLGFGSVGLGVSAKGDISLGLGVVSVTIDPRDANNSAIGFGFNTMTITGTKEGCTTTLFYKILGQVVNTETRVDPACKNSEPITEPDPKTKEDIKKNDKNQPDPPNDSGLSGLSDPIEIPVFPGKTYAIMYEGSGETDYYKMLSGDSTYWFLPIDGGDSAHTDVGDKIIPIFNKLSPETKVAFYEALGTSYTFAPWTTQIHQGQETFVPEGQNNEHQRYWYGEGITHWLSDYGGNTREPNFITPSWNTRVFMVYDNQNMQWFLKIDNYDGIPNRVKWLPGTPNLKIVEIPSIKPRQKSNTPTRTPVMDECCEETKEMINDIYEMLGGDDFLEKGIEIPNHLFIPGGKDDTQALTYNAILNILFRTLDHRTCGEVEVSIADNNIMKEGDQPLTMKFINNTAATGKIIELSQKQNSDLVAVLNLLMRLSWISVQLLKLINLINGTVNAITKFLDVPIREKIENVETPFDISLGQKVGFDQKKPSEDQLIKTLDLDNPEKTLSILDKFMNNAKIPLKIKTFIGTKEGGNFWWMMNKKG